MKNLYEMKIGDTAIIIKIACDDNIKQRILDLGMVRGTKIRPIFKSPSGNPIAYEIRGSTIAIRNDDAKKIYVEIIGDVSKWGTFPIWGHIFK